VGLAQGRLGNCGSQVKNGDNAARSSRAASMGRIFGKLGRKALKHLQSPHCSMLLDAFCTLCKGTSQPCGCFGSRSSTCCMGGMVHCVMTQLVGLHCPSLSCVLRLCCGWLLSCSYGILDYFFHHIADTHVAHHLFSQMPHYHAEVRAHAWLGPAAKPCLSTDSCLSRPSSPIS